MLVSPTNHPPNYPLNHPPIRLTIHPYMTYSFKAGPGPSNSSREQLLVDCVWNVMAHAQNPDFVFRRNERVHFNRRVRQFSRLLAAEVFTLVAVIVDAPCSEVVWRVLTTHSVRQVPLHFPSRASPCAIIFRSDCTYQPMKMEQSECSETLAYKIQTPGNYPEESIQHSEHGESLKSRT